MRGPRRLTARALAPSVHECTICPHSVLSHRCGRTSTQQPFVSRRMAFHATLGPPPAPAAARRPDLGPIVRAAPARAQPLAAAGEIQAKRSRRPAAGLGNSKTWARRCPQARCTVVLPKRPTGAPKGEACASGEEGASSLARALRACGLFGAVRRALLRSRSAPLDPGRSPRRSPQGLRREKAPQQYY